MSTAYERKAELVKWRNFFS